ncbi:tRNA lysidine(34) synthetase TilS [Thalassomonas sp. M1454]|uniref:tRNA lysidine(34) synthetase TilS n=1 Tax=Thalassomonas sp. M1454 TaxID=2594477 RepID=UPI00117F4819|nr:tRNA lysidine(34) synthetase TilS [Thalassomonas sp. M1454]TRX57084.1 tRNA lysidine(34) synthetase TilS [Thalassomonas sp. M1454]
MTEDVLHPICQQILNFCQQHLGNKNLTLAYSGGVDSQVLLHAVAQLRKAELLTNKINAVHINHGLSVNASKWASFCQQQAKQLSISYTSITVDINKQSQQSLEALARDARYKALNQACSNDSVIFTGHHLDDQVETFLLALKRGAGVQGLSAMQTIRPLANSEPEKNIQLARPLLNINREDIEQYAREHDLQWVEDDSNSDVRFDRNFIRAQILPLLKQRWPAINQTIARSAQHCEQAQHLLEQLAIVDLQNCQLSSDSLSIAKMASLSTDRFNNLLRHFIRVNGGLMPSKQQVAQVYNACFEAADDKNPHISLHQYSLRRFADALYFTPNYADISQWQLTLSLAPLVNEVIELPDGLGQLTLQRVINNTDLGTSDTDKFSTIIAIPRSSEQLSIGFKHDNPKCWPTYRDKRRPLKKLLQEHGVATWLRNRLPFIFIDNELAAVLPLFTCREFICKEFTSSESKDNKLANKQLIEQEQTLYLKITWLNV